MATKLELSAITPTLPLPRSRFGQKIMSNNFFHRILLVAVKIFISPHSAGSDKIYFHRVLLVAVKNFLSPLKR